MQQPPQAVELPWADQVARLALRVIIADMIVSVAMGLLVAVAWGVRPDNTFLNDLGSGPGGGRGIPAVVFMLAWFMGFPSLVRGLRDLTQGRWPEARRLLAFVGPLVVFVGFTYVAHGLDPCGGLLDEGSRLGDQPLCQRYGDSLEVHTRFHLLYHALVPTVFLVALYRLALGRWHSAITRGR
jgi:hypothetical protein